MATQTKRTAQTASTEAGDATGGALAAASSAADVSRQQLAAAAETMSVLFRAGESIQQAQLQMGQRAALLHSQAAENLRKAASPMEVLTIQSTLAVYQWQEAARFQQELLAAMAKAGSLLARPQHDGQEAPATGTASAAATMMDAAMSAAAPMASAFQQMFTTPMNGMAQPPH